MSAVLTVARASVTEHLRRKLVLFFALITIVVAAGVAYLTLSGNSQTELGVLAGFATAATLSLLPLTTTMAAVAVSMNNIGRPFADGEAMLVLVRPVARWQYAAGRLLASLSVVIGLCLFSAILIQAVTLVDQGNLSAGLWGHWATTAFNLIILVGLTNLVSGLVNAPVLAGFIAYFFYALAGFLPTMYGLVTASGSSGIVTNVVKAGYFLTPRTLTSPLISREAAGLPERMPLLNTSGRIWWSVAYMALVIAVTIVVVERKDL